MPIIYTRITLQPSVVPASHCYDLEQNLAWWWWLCLTCPFTFHHSYGASCTSVPFLVFECLAPQVCSFLPFLLSVWNLVIVALLARTWVHCPEHTNWLSPCSPNWVSCTCPPPPLWEPVTSNTGQQPS